MKSAAAARPALILAAVLASLGATAAQADSVSGECRYRSVNTPFTDGVVFKDKSVFDDNTIETVVVLATFPIDKAALAKTQAKGAALVSQRYGVEGAQTLRLRIADGKVGTADFVTSTGGSVSQSGGDIGTLTAKTNDATRIAADFMIEDDDEEDLQCQVSFDLAYATTTAATQGAAAAKPAAAAAAKGKALPAGGGEPGKVFQANLAAVQKGDVDAILGTVTKEQADEIRAHRKDPKFGAMLEMMKAFTPKSAIVTGGQDFGDTAELTIEAVEGTGDKSTGTSRLRKEGGAWKVEETNTKVSIKADM